MNANSVSFTRQLSTERIKSRHRHVWLIPMAILGFIALWMAWAYRIITPEDQQQGYSALFYQLPVLNTILFPLTIAVISSRICDMEIKGNTLKLLCTIQQRTVIYNCKLLYSLKYLISLCLGEALLILGTGWLCHFTEPLRLELLLSTFISTFMVGAALMIIQQTLSLLFENQLMPLIVGLAGSFLGLFSIYFPEKISQFVLWSYFCAFTPLRMDWEKSTRIVTYYDIPFPTVKFLGFVVFTIFLYLLGKHLFQRKEL